MTQLDLLGELADLDAAHLNLGFRWPLPPHEEIVTAYRTWYTSNQRPRPFHGWMVEDWTETETHNLTIYSADHRCGEPHDLEYDEFREGSKHHCIGEQIFVARCQPCEWQTTPRLNPNAVAELWHDHAWPGWRDLPPIPRELQGMHPTTYQPVWKKNAKWRAENYGPEWDKPGAPVITERDKYASRHVPGRSPHGGYDISPTRATSAPEGGK